MGIAGSFHGPDLIFIVFKVNKSMVEGSLAFAIGGSGVLQDVVALFSILAPSSSLGGWNFGDPGPVGFLRTHGGGVGILRFPCYLPIVVVLLVCDS